MAEVKNEIRKLPVKIHDMIKKEQKSVAMSISNMETAMRECDNYKQTVLNLTTMLQQQNQEMWKLQRALISQGQTSVQLTSQNQSVGATCRDTTSPPRGRQDKGQGGTTLPTPDTMTRDNHTKPDASHPLSQSLPYKGMVRNNSSPPIHFAQPHVLSEAAGAQSSLPSTSRGYTHETHMVNRADRAAVKPTAPPGDTMPRPHPLTSPVPDPRRTSAGDGANDSEASIERQERGHQLDRRQPKGDAILIGDSTVKYIDKERFLSRSFKTHIQRFSTSEITKKHVDEWQRDIDVKYVIIHNGVNDVRDGKSAEYIINNLKGTFTKLSTILPNAELSYSEMLYIGSEISNPELNSKVKAINENMRAWCSENGMTFIPHRSLQTGGDDLFDDNVHISRGGGTALFVSDVHRAVGLHRGGRPRDGQTYTPIKYCCFDTAV